MDNVEQLLTVLQDIRQHITRIYENFKKTPKSRLTEGYVETKMSILQEYWVAFTNNHNSLIRIVTKEQRKSLEYFKNEVFVDCEENYIQGKAAMKNFLQPAHPQSSSIPAIGSPPSMKQQVKLPNIEVPTFAGNYEDWPTFQDLFISLIHKNDGISKVQKLQYLKLSVSGEAENLLKHIQVTEDNYDQAWEVLRQRYNNKRLIVTSILRKLFNQKRLQSPSVSHIKALLDTTNQCLHSLNNLNINTDQWDPLIVYIITNKLDLESQKGWEEYVSKEVSGDLPTFSILKKFLEIKFRTLELLQSSTKEKNTVHTYHTTTNFKGCVLCKEHHALCHCKSFGKMDLQKRREYINQNNICYNCLIPGHPVKYCRSSSTCRICHKRHHTLLHHSPTASTQGNLLQEYQTQHCNTATGPTYKDLS
ncbi:uncharacterized protein LOC123722565 isoform X1 [Papilio machaon]|uniref:uncharacterized protein LOC123722565 isoform X1 n=1 Tax=Papilio machaon TaxID=76193 RepID=UPI001E665C80|nr:uncharacterized protein LOC123722565 isoform X1 [Papilio machaon]